MQTKLKRWLRCHPINYAVLFTIIGLLLYRQCNTPRGAVATLPPKGNYPLKIIKNKDSSTVAQAPLTAATNTQLKKLYPKQTKGFTRVESVVKTELKVKVDTVFVPIPQAYFVPNPTDSNLLCLSLPYTFNKNSKWYYLFGEINRNGLVIDSLGLRNTELTAVVGYKRQGLFKRPLPLVELTSTNPYIQPIALNATVAKQSRKPILLSRTAMLLYGFAAGWVVGKL